MGVDIELFKTSKLVYNCKTEKDLVSFLGELRKEGIVVSNHLYSFDKNIGIRFNERGNCCCNGFIYYYRQSGYTVVEYEYKEGAKKMKLSDLKTGMMVEARNGTRYFVLVGDIPTFFGKKDIVFTSNNTWICGTDFGNDLLSKTEKDLDIMKVYNFQVGAFDTTMRKRGEPIWERKEIDWSKVAIDTKILVNKNGTVVPRYFSEYKGGKIIVFCCGRSSYTTRVECYGGDTYVCEPNEVTLA